MFGDAVDYGRVTIRRRKWFPFQPRNVAMAPRGHIHFHPRGENYRDDFSAEPVGWQGYFIHEMTHVWQYQRFGFVYIALKRPPFSSYNYTLRDGWPLGRYGLEQQAEIVRHAFIASKGSRTASMADPSRYAELVTPRTFV